MRRKDKNHVFILVLIVALMTVGYATFAQPLASKLSTKATGSEWNIGFTNVIRSDVSGSAKELSPLEYSETSANFNIYLGASGDAITYDFTVKNMGTLDAKVSSIYLFPANEANDLVLFDISGLQVGDELKVGEIANMKIKAYYNPAAGSKAAVGNKSVTVQVNYSQK